MVLGWPPPALAACPLRPRSVPGDLSLILPPLVSRSSVGAPAADVGRDPQSQRRGGPDGVRPSASRRHTSLEWFPIILSLDVDRKGSGDPPFSRARNPMYSRRKQ